MNLWLPYTPCLVHPLWIVTWKVRCPCVSLHVCPIPLWLWSHNLFRMCTCISTWIYVHMAAPVWQCVCVPVILFLVATPCLEVVYPCISHMNLCLPLHPMYVVPPPMDSYMWKLGAPVCHCMCVQVHLIFVATPCLECVPPISTWIWCPPGCPCIAVCLCPSHLISVATPCLECVHASVHEFMSTLHPMYGPPSMDSYMESWECLCVTACMSKSPYFCCYTLFRMCTSISTWIYVHLAAYVWFSPYA